MMGFVICNSCGGKCEEELEKCPYCGSTLLAGAEKKYMEQLRDVRERMEDLKEAPMEETKTAIRKQGKALKVGLILGVVLIALACAFLWLMNARTQLSEEEYKQQYLWKQEMYPQMDELYAAGDFEGLVQFYYEHLDDPHQVIYSWEHYNFLDVYTSLWDCTEDMKNGLSLPPASIFADEWCAKGVLAMSEQYTEAEYAALLPIIEVLEQDYQTRWNIDPEEEQLLYQMLKDNNYRYLDFDTCQEYAEKWSKEN